ncbi:MAG TPA: hypothetical protein VJ785_01770 [Anaerolineales bacterium]|nr:hypothetical protein [Anaerolineales bacterium]
MNEQIVEQPKRRTGLLIWMVVSQLLAVASLLIWLLIAGLSVMAFDQGSTPEAWAFVITVWSYPIIPIVLVIAAWIAFARRRNTTAAVLSGLSFAPPILFYLCLAVSSFSWYFTNWDF